MSENLKLPFKTDHELSGEYLIHQAMLAGISITNTIASKLQVRQKLDEPWMQKYRKEWESWLNEIYDIHSAWAQSQIIILVDGGSISDREYVSQAFLFRSIVNNAHSGQYTALSKRSDELVRVFSQFGDIREVLLNNLRRVHCLLIGDIADQTPTAASMGHLYFNELLQARQQSCYPTILTFASPINPERNYGEFSRLLDEITKQPDNGLRKVYHFRLESKE